MTVWYTVITARTQPMFYCSSLQIFFLFLCGGKNSKTNPNYSFFRKYNLLCMFMQSAFLQGKCFKPYIVSLLGQERNFFSTLHRPYVFQFVTVARLIIRFFASFSTLLFCLLVYPDFSYTWYDLRVVRHLLHCYSL